MLIGTKSSENTEDYDHSWPEHEPQTLEIPIQKSRKIQITIDVYINVSYYFFPLIPCGVYGLILL